jgi:hypothetical protein
MNESLWQRFFILLCQGESGTFRGNIYFNL